MLVTNHHTPHSFLHWVLKTSVYLFATTVGQVLQQEDVINHPKPQRPVHLFLTHESVGFLGLFWIHLGWASGSGLRSGLTHMSLILGSSSKSP